VRLFAISSVSIGILPRGDIIVHLVTSIIHLPFMIQFTLYSRTYCHLCDDMLSQLRVFLNDESIIVDVVDVDLDEALVVKFDELVPVLYGKKERLDAQEICHYHLDVSKLKVFLDGE
jgi:hypothetical protein